MKVLNKTWKVQVPESQNHKVRNSIPNIMCHYILVSRYFMCEIYTNSDHFQTLL